MKYRMTKNPFDLENENFPREDKRIVKNYRPSYNEYEELVRNNEERINR